MSTPNYRVVLSFDGERKVFLARAPELDHLCGEGATRSEAILKLEQEIEAQLLNMKDRGQRLPPAVDEHTWTGEITTKVSRTLHRDLAWQARQEGIDLPHLLSEILAQGLEGRKHHQRRQRPADSQPSHVDEPGNSRGPQQREGNYEGRGGRQGYNSRYHGILDDRANFIEYVRGLDQGPRGRQQGDNRGDRGDRGDNRGGGDRGRGDWAGRDRGRRGPNNKRPGGPRPDRGDRQQGERPQQQSHGDRPQQAERAPEAKTKVEGET